MPREHQLHPALLAIVSAVRLHTPLRGPSTPLSPPTPLHLLLHLPLPLLSEPLLPRLLKQSVDSIAVLLLAGRVVKESVAKELQYAGMLAVLGVRDAREETRAAMTSSLSVAPLLPNPSLLPLPDHPTPSRHILALVASPLAR